MAPPRKPTKLKILQGTTRKDRMVENEPEPENKIPSPPSHLNKTAVCEWERISVELFRLGLLSEIDRSALAGYCEAYSLWVEACEYKNEMAQKDPSNKGLLDTTSNMNVIQAPIVGIINQSRKAMKDFLVEFGMSPASRTRVSSKLSENDKSKQEPFTVMKKKAN